MIQLVLAIVGRLSLIGLAIVAQVSFLLLSGPSLLWVGVGSIVECDQRPPIFSLRHARTFRVRTIQVPLPGTSPQSSYSYCLYIISMFWRRGTLIRFTRICMFFWQVPDRFWKSRQVPL
jgi:hypothetical protein